MSRYASYGSRDTQAVTDGDNYFKGLDLKHDRALLGQGMVAKSINKRLRTGAAATRPGTRTPLDFNPNPASYTYPEVPDSFLARFVGSCIYSNPNGQEVLLIAESNRNFVWELRDGLVTPNKVPLNGGATHSWDFADGLVYTVIRQSASDAGRVRPMIWDGLDYDTDSGGFRNITKFDPGDTSTVLIPNVTYGVPFQNRMLYVWQNDHILMSDVLDYLSYDPILADFRINAGESDRILCIHEYTRQSVLVFMERSIHLFSNFTIDPNLASQQQISDELGCVGREAAVHVGSDIIFLSRAGFYKVSQLFTGQMSSPALPISDLISPLMEGINWDLVDHIGQVSMAVLEDYCHISVPIGRTDPRNVLVYNTVTSMWESVDAWADPNVFVNALRVTNFDGERRVFGINYSHYRVYLLYEGVTDQLTLPPVFTVPVNDILETRGYFGQDPLGFKRFDRVHLALRTRAPAAAVYALSDGYNEEKLITPNGITKDTTKFYVWGHKDFAAGDDPNEPKREDYYTGSETEWVAQDMENLLPGSIDLLPAVDSEMLGGPTTESLERFSIRQIGRWCSIRIENFNGVCDVLGVTVDAQERENVVRTAA